MSVGAEALLSPVADDREPLDPKIVEQAIAWQVLLASGNADAAQEQACRDWCAAHVDHQRAWQRISALTLGVKQAGADIEPPLARAVLRNAVGSGRRIVLKSLVGFGVIGGSALLARETHWWRDMGAEYRTATGEQRWLTLADGTRVLLNTDSAADVVFDEQIRRLRLRGGEVLVVTAPDAQGRPFEVLTAGGSVRPVGTRFTVRQDENDTVSVAVFEGAVDIHPLRGDIVRLHAGEQSRFSSAAAASPRALEAGQGAWVDGMLVVERMRLGDFLAELDRYRPGYLRCDPAVAELRVSGAFSLRAPDDVLALLADTLPVRVRYVSRYWVRVGPRA